MIRRGFWLTAGAVTGIYAYRRVSALGRRLSGRLSPAGPVQDAQQIRGTRQVHRGAINAARQTYRFTRDVREGMDLYTARHSRSAGPTLSRDHEPTTYEPEDGH